MILWFNQVQNGHQNAISGLRGFHGNIGLFFAVLEKLGHAPFLWWSEMLRVRVDFERSVITLLLELDGLRGHVEQSIDFDDWLNLSYPELVWKYMRPFSSAIARRWDLPLTARVIEAGGNVEQIEEAVFRENPHEAKPLGVCLTNILYEDAEVPWHGQNLVK